MLASLSVIKMRARTLTLLQIVLNATSVKSAPAPQPNGTTLVLLHVLFRHGNRTPDKFSMFPNDPHKFETYKPIGLSQLTLKGQQTEYQIGQSLRKKYNGFIPQQYTPNTVYALSTNFKRTKMSLELVLAGLFPPTASQRFQSTLNWQPIPFNVEQGPGVIGVPFVYCPQFINAYYKYLVSTPGRDAISEYYDLYKTLSRKSGLDVKSPKDVCNIYHTLKSEEDYGLQLPDWTEDLYSEALEEACSVDFELSTATPTLRKFSAGFLLKKILEDSNAKRNNMLAEEKRIFLYSAHEFNIGVMLRTMNVFEKHVPPFGATLFFEIHNIDNVFGLQLYYQDYSEERPRLLTIPGCNSFCPLDELYKLLADSLPGENDVCVFYDEVA